MNTIFFVIHVALAVFIVGPMVTLPMTALRAIRAGHTQTVQTLTTPTRIFTYLSIAIALIGFAVVGTTSTDDNFKVSTPWILTSIILYVVALGVALFVVVPSLSAAGTAMAESKDPVAAGAKYRGRLAASSGIVSLLLLVIVVLMVWQP